MSRLDRTDAYGANAGAVLRAVAPYLDAVTKQFVVEFYDDLAARPGPSTLLAHLTPEEYARLQERQAAHLRRMFDPALAEEMHRASARAVGRIHSLTGVEPGWIVDAYEHYRHLILDLSRLTQRDFRAFREVLDQRLSIELHEQLDAARELHEKQHAALQRIDQLIASSTTFIDLASGVLESIVALDGISTGAISRPDPLGNLQYEVTAGEKARRYLDMLAAGKAPPISIHADRPTGKGPSGRAWRSGAVEHTLAMALDPAMAVWQEMLAEFQLRSAATIPVLDNDDRPQLLIQLWSDLTGHFITPLRQTLIEHLQRALGHAFARLAQRDQQSLVVVPQGSRLEWRELLQHDGLEMHFQPIVDLANGRLHKVEALARLRNARGEIVPPSQFLPAFGEWELQRLFAQGLDRGVEALRTWESQGVVTAISINLPPQGIKDPRYLDILRETLARTNADPTRITLELLETGTVDHVGAPTTITDALRTMGVCLAEDDLGSGYSSLLRMDRITFDEMKIDQGLVSNSSQTPRKALGFIHYLTRLSHDFGIPVTVEGLENAGLVEAAVILSANMGQGYAIAPPMKATELADWAKRFTLSVDRTQPKTALGAFATNMLWHLQLLSLSPWRELLDNFLSMPSSLAHYITRQGLQGTPLHEAHDELHAVASSHGPTDTLYWNARGRVEALLAERIALENE